MATQVIRTTFQLKRGTAARWRELNPVLRQGEPGFEYDTGKLKIGNGLDAYMDLPYQTNKDYVVNRPTSATFPLIGEPNVIYKADNEKVLYQWNDETNDYEALNSIDLSEINALIETLKNKDVEIENSILQLSEKINKITEGAPEEFDTLKELYDYVTNLEINGAESTIAGIIIEGKPLEIVDKFIEIPLANYIQAGLVKSADSVNKIQVQEDGTMEVHSLGVSKLVQEEDLTLVLDSGDSFE